MIGRWQIDVKGDWNTAKEPEGYEISVLREDNKSGKKSFGWCDENKLLIASDEVYGEISEEFWNKLVRLANQIADILNSEKS